jgi:hypothetical protein
VNCAALKLAILALCVGDIGPTEDQFVRLIESAYDSIHDLEFIYEGEMKWTGSPSRTKPKSSVDKTYQGSFVFKYPNNRLIDTRVNFLDPQSSDVRHIKSQCREKTDFIIHMIDANRVRIPSNQEPYLPFSRFTSCSPERMFHVAILLAMANKGIPFRFEPTGWELIDGHQCLKVRLDTDPRNNDPKNEPYQVYWFDVGRGWHPIREEAYLKGKLLSRTNVTAFGQFRGPDGTSVWLPLRSTTEQFMWNFEWSDQPFIVETQDIVHDTIRLNQGIPDSRFELRPIMAKLGGPSPRKPGMKPQDIEAHLTSLLAASQEQARMAEASSAARTGWGGWTLARAVVLAIGGLAIVAAWRLRSRS